MSGALLMANGTSVLYDEIVEGFMSSAVVTQLEFDEYHFKVKCR